MEQNTNVTSLIVQFEHVLYFICYSTSEFTSTCISHQILYQCHYIHVGTCPAETIASITTLNIFLGTLIKYMSYYMAYVSCIFYRVYGTVYTHSAYHPHFSWIHFLHLLHYYSNHVHVHVLLVILKKVLSLL